MDSEIMLYQSEDGQTKVEVRMEGETVWLTLNQLVELFQRDKSVISRHIKNVFEEGELSPEGQRLVCTIPKTAKPPWNFSRSYKTNCFEQ